MILKPKALLFDLNGTMIDDMAYHLVAWSEVLNQDLKAGLSPEEVRAQMYGKNDELLKRVFGPSFFSEAEMKKISIEKEKLYQAAYLPHLRLIGGLPVLLEHASERNIQMAIGSAAIPFNIDFVLDNLGIRHYFKAIVSADDVIFSKPNPETFLKAASMLDTKPGDCIVFEDAPQGVEAALHAGMPAVVLTTTHEKNEFEPYNNVLAFIKDYQDPYLLELFD
jgi:beta-phosphoglucomutase